MTKAFNNIDIAEVNEIKMTYKLLDFATVFKGRRTLIDLKLYNVSLESLSPGNQQVTTIKKSNIFQFDFK